MAETLIDAYTCAEVDEKLENLKDEMLGKIGKIIIMSDDSTAQSLDDTSLFMKIESVK